MRTASPWTHEQAMADYERFHELAVGTGDVDPVYPVLVGVCRALDLDEQEAAWLALLHVAFYDLGSALVAFAVSGRIPNELPEAALKLPCGTERRGHRDPRQLAAHLRSLTARCAAYGGAGSWLRAMAGYTTLGYESLFARVQEVHGNGRWAGYKTCELVSNVLRGYDPRWLGVEPTDMGHAYSTGPRHGMALLTALPPGNSSSAVARLDELSAALVAHLHGRGLMASAATAETTLCDFHSLTAGRYYVGHDIDQMGAQLRRADDRVTDTAYDAGMDRFADACTVIEAAWNARATALPSAYLGERADPPRYAVDKPRTRLYREQRLIAVRPDPPNLPGGNVDTATTAAVDGR